MASAESVEAIVSVGEVFAMNDAELAEFMQRHRRPNGDYQLPVDGWDKLSKDERSRLAERLEAQKKSLAQSPTACSRPLDLDDLDARLRQVSSDKSCSLQPENPTIYQQWSPTPPFDPTLRETEAYHELLNEGGRPLYPINLIQDVYRDPDNYAKILWPWQENITPVSPSGIFQKQLHRWQDFRKWQNDNRGLEDDDGGYPAYLERWKHIVKRDFLPRSRAKYLAEIEADPSCRKSQWENLQWERERQRDHCRERGCRGFRDYTEAWLDKHTGDIQRLEPKHDKLWQELVGKNVLRPHETKEFVRTDASAIALEADEEQAKKAVQRAESEAERIYVLTQEDPKRLSIPQAKRISMLKHGTQKLQAAKRRSEQVQRRSNLIVQFVRATFDYSGAKRRTARHRILVQWVLEQVPLVDAEVNPSKANRLEPDERQRTKRRRTTDEEPPKRQNPKRVKVDLRESRVASTKVRSKAIETRAEPGTVMG
ncbi:hypothetical protein MGU_06260 [Metarhizium guizhouense ARSEF 977]|uniref:Ankyrin 2,3/unc44 n=1 Tax=Metarhizium guizhouense (strain ARSEF 977) TaxID=1276136 RepID=A0A0B4GUW3_METGA|nr:hypothetical protein MGU_06260 [Metarhizium guizhouense ARSEF 977]